MSLLPSGAIETGGYNINNSLRFRSSASAYLNRTPASASNRRTWTWSGWVKRGAIANRQGLFDGYSNGTNFTQLIFESDHRLYLYTCVGSPSFIDYSYETVAVFRDPSAWYHIVVAVNTTHATQSERCIIYVNGIRQTLTSAYGQLDQNFDTYINSNSSHSIGRAVDPNAYLDGYIAEVNFIDGQALTPSSFGETDAVTGSWVAKKYTGTYGTNGFYLPFSLSATSSYAGSFNGSNQYLSLPSSSAWDLSTGDWTIETWFKFSSISSNGSAIVGNADVFFGNGGFGVRIDPSYAITLYGNGNSQGNYAIGSSALSANQWHHLAIVRSGTGANSVSLYLDGVRYTATGNGANNPTFASNSTGIAIGYGNYASSYFNGNISNLRIVKGYAQYAINASGITVPSSPLTAVTGTSLLTLQNATIIDNSTNAFTITNNNTVTSATNTPFVANIFTDNSGNKNNWVGNNINYTTSGTTYDAMTDSPTLTSATVANYCVLNPLNIYSSYSITNANQTFSLTASSGTYFARSTIGISSGKWYWEVIPSDVGGGPNIFVGIQLTSYNSTSATQDNMASGYAYWANAEKFNGTTRTAYGATYTNNDVIGVAFDADSGTLTFYKNNTSQGTAFTSISGEYTPTIALSGGATSRTIAGSINFGQRPFTYTPPTGYKALNTYNLPDSTIKKGNKYMDATLYTGNGSTQSITNAGGFKPDFVWYKQRNTARDNGLEDSVRGTSKIIISNSTAAEVTASGITGFNSNGFSIGNNVIGNESGGTYVGWQWQAGQGTTSSGTGTGGITSVTMSVNATAGFSIVTYTGSGANGTVTHGLGVAPYMIIVKNRTVVNSWNVYHNSLGGTKVIYLNSTLAAATSSAAWNNTSPTSSVFSLSTDSNGNGNGNPMVAYCFAEIAGFSKFGGYTGNGSTDGTFVYTGFRPKFIMIKCTSNADSWYMLDTSRSSYNTANARLFADLSSAESTADNIDILSNGFKNRSSTTLNNLNGGTYIYMAFAENPFKNSLAR